jgi:hypothetical protein
MEQRSKRNTKGTWKEEEIIVTNFLDSKVYTVNAMAVMTHILLCPNNYLITIYHHLSGTWLRPLNLWNLASNL